MEKKKKELTRKQMWIIIGLYFLLSIASFIASASFAIAALLQVGKNREMILIDLLIFQFFLDLGMLFWSLFNVSFDEYSDKL